MVIPNHCTMSSPHCTMSDAATSPRYKAVPIAVSPRYSPTEPHAALVEAVNAIAEARRAIVNVSHFGNFRDDPNFFINAVKSLDAMHVQMQSARLVQAEKRVCLLEERLRVLEERESFRIREERRLLANER